MMIRRLTAVFVLAGLVVVSNATPAFAHAELISSTPAQGASLGAAPAQVQLTFNEAVSPESITVTGPPGAQWTVGQVKVEGPVVTAPLTASGPAGPYAINYRVLSDDGDPVSGTVAFTMTSPAEISATARPETRPAAPDSSGKDDSGLPTWLWIVGLAVLLGAGAVIGRRVGNRSGSGTDDR